MAYILPKTERLILQKIYPVGSRVQLEHIESEPANQVLPGELGTVAIIDNNGGMHIVWDSGRRFALVYREDQCRCLMTREDMEKFLKILSIMPFESEEKLEAWLERKLKHIFPAITINKKRRQMLDIALHVDAFQMNDIKISVKYRIDDKGHLFIIKSGWGGKSNE